MTMQKRLTKKDRFFNNINLTLDDDVYVGIDVHKTNCHGKTTGSALMENADR